MNHFEPDLREALKHREPPTGFADRVLERARASERHAKSWLWVAAAALILAMAGGGLFLQQRQRQIENEAAKEQLMVALRITGSKVRLVQKHLSAIQQRTIPLHTRQ